MIGCSLLERALRRDGHNSPVALGAATPTQTKVRLRSVLGMTNRGISAFAAAAGGLTLSRQFLVPHKVSVLPPFLSQASTRLGTCGVGFSGGISLTGASVRLLGLTHRYAMRYGTLPIVRRTGGLADTVVGCSEATMHDGSANGFTFDQATAEDMLACLDRALALYRQPVAWRRIQRRAMEHYHGWEEAAHQYMDIYRRLAPNAGLEQGAAEFDLLAEIRA